MLSYRRVLTIALTSAFAVPLLSHAAIPFQYRVTDIGSLGGSTTHAAALNNASPVQVTGTSWLGEDTGPRAFLYTVGGSMTAISHGVDEASWGRGINDDGYVSADGGMTGFVYHNGVTTALPALSPTLDGSTIGGISNSGFVTGTAYSSTGAGAHAFRYSLVDNSMVDLGTAGGLSNTSRGTAVNDAGQVAGSVRDAVGQHGHAMFFDGTTLHDIHVASTYYGDAYDVNDSGQVVGQAALVVGNQLIDRAFLHDGNTGTTTLLTPLVGSDWDLASHINNQGQIVGLGVTSVGVRAVLWSDNQVIDLNTRLEPNELSPHVVLEHAVDINESGWILVNGFDTRVGTTRAFLLEPIWP